MSSKQRVFAITIFGYRKPGLDEEEYHNYVSENHATCLKDLLVKNKIIGYTIVGHYCHPFLRNCEVDIKKQHNTSETKKMMEQIFGDVPEGRVAGYDCIAQIVFRDVQDYIKVREDPHYKQVVFPDHAHFADTDRTTMVTGWFETHVADGKPA